MRGVFMYWISVIDAKEFKKDSQKLSYRHKVEKYKKIKKN